MIKKITVGLVVAAIMLSGSFTHVDAQNMSLSQLVDLFISLGIIPPEKAAAAKSATTETGVSATAVQKTSETQNSSCYTFSSDFGVGSSGEKVSMLQKFIIGESAVGGIYNKDVSNAVVKFQAQYGIRQTGYVGPATRAKLNSLYSCSVPSTFTVSKERKNGLKVLAPNGGEVLTQGTTKIISWQNSNVSKGSCVINVSAGVTSCPATYQAYDISLVEYKESCPGGVYCMAVESSMYSIIKGVSGTTYNWSVGNADVKGGAPNGTYMVRVCEAGTNTCDTSDSYFKLVSPTINQPYINSIEPSGAVAGSVVTIYGTNLYFAGDVVNTSVTFNNSTTDSGVNPTNILYDGTSMTFVVPQLPAGSYNLSVEGIGVSGRSNYVPFNIISSSGQPSVTVLSPNGGEQYATGGSYEIKWSALNFSTNSTVYIELRPYSYNPSVRSSKIAVASSMDGRYLWQIPNTIVSGQYNIEIYKADQNGNIDPNESIKDLSNAPFTITATTNQPSITVLSPNGGDVAVPGVVFDVKWTTTNIPSWMSVNFELYKGSSLVKTYSGYANSGMGQIVLPEVQPGNDYKIAVVYGDSRDFSDNYFTVVSSVSGGYDSCRLDTLEGANITRGIYPEKTACLSQLCDIYGPANANNGANSISSKCVFQGAEIKRYTAVTINNYHSADINKDWKIDDSELKIFTSLYNYRSGTSRTGEYSCSFSVVGGYQAGPGDKSCTQHSGDSNKDWKISLLELTRVTELKNASGYKVQEGTEDGFASIVTTVPVSAQFSVVGTPTITRIPVASTDDSGYATSTASASFTLNITAVDGDVIIGGPTTNRPLFSTTSMESIMVYKAGAPAGSVASVATPGTVALISYMVPSSGVEAASAGLVIADGSTVQIPINVQFTVSGYSSNFYAVELKEALWTSSKIVGVSTSPVTGNNKTGVVSLADASTRSNLGAAYFSYEDVIRLFNVLR